MVSFLTREAVPRNCSAQWYPWTACEGLCGNLLGTQNRSRYCDTDNGLQVVTENRSCTPPECTTTGRLLLDPLKNICNPFIQYFVLRQFCRISAAANPTSMLAPSVCPILITPKHASPQTPCFTFVGAICEHHCNYGYYKASGTPKRTCTNSGEWSGSDLVCLREYILQHTTLNRQSKHKYI